MGTHMKCVLTTMVTSMAALFMCGFISVRSTTTGAEVRWPQFSQLTFRTNITNSSGLSGANIFSIFTTSLNRWRQASFNAFSFAYYQGTDTSRYPNYLGSPEDNSIFFTSNASAADQLSCGVIALTQVWYDPTNGVANKAELRFNDNCFHFSMNPSDSLNRGSVYLGDVATHETGHALGLDHSQNLQSSLVYTAGLEMSIPSCDDRAAMLHLYGGLIEAAAGTLSGKVLSPAGSPVFGAHVNAIQLDRGVVMASAMTDRDGSFAVRGLEPGTYSLMIEPFYPGAGSLGLYYASINSAVCSGYSFARTFVTSASGLATFAVDSGHNTSAGTVTVNCTIPRSGTNAAEQSLSSAPLLASGNLGAAVGAQSVFSGSASHYYRLPMQSGTLVATAVGYSIFSNVDAQVEFLDSSGRTLAQTTTDPIFASALSGYANYDSSARVELDHAQDVYVHIYAHGSIASTSFPSANSVSSSPYYVLAVSRGAPGQSLFATNARCEASDDFGPYPDLGEASSFDQKNSGLFGCGAISSSSGGGMDGRGTGGATFRASGFAGLGPFRRGTLIALGNLAVIFLSAFTGKQILAHKREAKYATREAQHEA